MGTIVVLSLVAAAWLKIERQANRFSAGETAVDAEDAISSIYKRYHYYNE